MSRDGFTHVFCRQVWLVKVPSVGNVRSMNSWSHQPIASHPFLVDPIPTFNDQRRVRSNQHCTSSHPSYRSRTPFLVNGNVPTHDDCVPSIPRFGLDPVNAIEQRRSGTITRILVVDAFDVMVAGRGEEVHQEGFGRFGFVDKSFGTDVETTDGFGVDVVFLEEG